MLVSPSVPNRGHDPTCPAVFGGVVDPSGIVSSIGDDSLHFVPCVIDHLDPSFSVIDVRASECFGNNDPIAVDSEMQLLPAPDASLAVFSGCPLAFTEDREAGAVDDQADGAGVRYGPQLDLQGLASAREGGVIRDVIDCWSLGCLLRVCGGLSAIGGY